MPFRTNHHPTSPVAYIGGKSRLAPTIIALMPSDRSCYVEVFGGGGHVIIQKPPERNEVYNDVQDIVVNFFLVVREHKEELIRRIERMPYSRREHERILAWWNAGSPGPVTDIERAARWFFLIKSSFSTVIGNQFAYGRGDKVHMMTARFGRIADRLDQLSERLSNVLIERSDFDPLIRRYDDPGAVFYLDPPYVGCEKYYSASGFTAKDHQRLAAVLSGMKGRAIVSYYDDPLVEELYPRGTWARRRIGVVKHAAISRLSQSKPRGVELLLMNFDAKTGRRLDERRAGSKRKRRAADA